MFLDNWNGRQNEPEKHGIRNVLGKRTSLTVVEDYTKNSSRNLSGAPASFGKCRDLVENSAFSVTS
jgi:hypothetical protein